MHSMTIHLVQDEIGRFLSDEQPGVLVIAGKWGVGTRLIPGVDKYTAAFEKIGFFWVKRQIVCIDDLERKSASLDMRDVLGLVSQLKEQRACKVVLLLNDERFQGEDEAEFREQLEKVADVTLRFEPTPKEAAAIGVDGAVPFHEELRQNCAALGIVNIRTIKKIETMAKRLHAELVSFDPRVFQQALHTLTLLEFAKLQPAGAPSLEYIRTLNDYDTAFQDLLAEHEQPRKQAEWQALLSSYGFGEMDELDGAIFKAVCEGHVDPGLIRKEAGAREKRLKASDADQSFQEAWELYHGSFDDNADEVANALADAVGKTPHAISPTNLSGTIGLLKDLGWGGDINELIAGYIVARADATKDFWDLPRSTFGGEVRDTDVRQAFGEKLATFSEGRDPVAVLHEIAREKGWNPDDVTFLATLSADDFYAMFKRLRGMELRRAISGALWFRNVGNADESMTTITANALAALQRIGQESEINRRRVTQRGVDVPEREDAGEANQ